MPDRPANALIEFIRAQAGGDPAAPSDRELLRRFAADQDAAAFEAVLRRHGPMVLRACRRVLGRREDAEDAFQATFLVLARKAGAANWRESVGTWLYEVAHRVAREVRRKRARRLAREAAAGPKPAADPLAEISGRELIAVLDEELAGLPARYRDPLLLCCLEGKSGDEAARDLGCSASTLKRRLRSARDLLHDRLGRRGLTLPASAVASLLFLGPAAALPPGLAAGAARAAVLLASGRPPAAGAVSEGAAAYAAAVLRAMGGTKLRAWVVAAAAAAGLAAGVLGLAAEAPEPSRPPDRAGLVGPVAGPGVRPDPAADPGPPGPVLATVEATLATGGERVRQFAFDGRPDTYFASARNPTRADHLTLRFDRPVDVRAVSAATGRPGGGDALDAGTLEVSADGVAFAPAAAFAGGSARAELGGRPVRAVRVKPAADLGHPLVVREVAVDSTPEVVRFAHPVEFVVDAGEAPDVREWAERAARACERHYGMICDELASDGYEPPPSCG